MSEQPRFLSENFLPLRRIGGTINLFESISTYTSSAKQEKKNLGPKYTWIQWRRFEETWSAIFHMCKIKL